MNSKHKPMTYLVYITPDLTYPIMSGNILDMNDVYQTYSFYYYYYLLFLQLLMLNYVVLFVKFR